MLSSKLKLKFGQSPKLNIFIDEEVSRLLNKNNVLTATNLSLLDKKIVNEA
jgi:hypothetical protein